MGLSTEKSSLLVSVLAMISVLHRDPLTEGKPWETRGAGRKPNAAGCRLLSRRTTNAAVGLDMVKGVGVASVYRTQKNQSKDGS